MNSDAVYLHMTRLAWRNVLLNWRHSLATLVAIAAGFISICAFKGFVEDTKLNGTNGFSRRYMMGEAVVTHTGADISQNADMWKNSLSKDEQDFLEDFFAHDPSFVRRVRFLSIFGMASAGSRSTIYMGTGYDVKEGEAMRGPNYARNAISGENLPADRPGVVVGISLGQLLGCSGGFKDRSAARANGAVDMNNVLPLTCAEPHITLTTSTEGANVNTIELPVVGLIDGTFHELDRALLNMSLDNAQKLANTDKITFVGVGLKDAADFAGFRQRLAAAAQAKGIQVEARSWRDFGMGAQLAAQIILLDLLSAIFGTIVIGICVMSVANTMMKSVTERVREIGTLRSLGFLRAHIVYMFALEGMFISLLACGIGLVLTIGLGEFIGFLNIGYTAGLSATPLVVRVGWVPGTWAACIACLSLLATGTSTISSRRAARMVIADAMRHT